MYSLQSSGFSVTPAIQEQVETTLAGIDKVFPKDYSIKVFLKKVRKNFFEVKMVSRAWKHDFVATAEGENLYTLITTVRNQIYREVHRMQEKHISGRYDKGTPAEPETAPAEHEFDS